MKYFVQQQEPFCKWSGSSAPTWIVPCIWEFNCVWCRHVTFLVALQYILLSKWNKMQCMNYKMDIVFFLSHQCHQNKLLHIFVARFANQFSSSGQPLPLRAEKELWIWLWAAPTTLAKVHVIFIHINFVPRRGLVDRTKIVLLKYSFSDFCSALIGFCYLNVHFLETANYLIKNILLIL